MSITQKCKVDGCNRPWRYSKARGKRYLVKGYCHTHYQRQLRMGSIIPSVGDERHHIVKDGTAMIPIGVNAKDGYAIVDNNFIWLEKYKWRISNGNYAQTVINKRTVKMHNIVFGNIPKHRVIDHINRKPLDNRLSNLRLATQAQNAFNHKIRSDNKTGYSGVVAWGKKYRVLLVAHGVKYNGGKLFNNIKEAAKKYNELAIKYHGKFASLNKL